MTDKTQHYSLNRGIDYDVLLKHFKNQADGVINHRSTTSRPRNNHSCIKAYGGRIIMVNKPKKNY